jgi:hypothetical protein
LDFGERRRHLGAEIQAKESEQKRADYQEKGKIGCSGP